MPEIQDSHGERPPVARQRRRRHRRRPLLVRYWWILPIAAGCAFLPAIWRFLANPRFQHDPLPGYISDKARIAEEYQEFTGKSLNDDASLHQFDQATQQMLFGNYGNSVVLLEGIARQIAVPAVFNDLGILYMKVNDGPHAVQSFRNALARDHDYQPVRANLKRWNLASAIDPATHEVEPNNIDVEANPIWIDRPVEGEIPPGLVDQDCYWFTTMRPPRDRLSITVTNHSVTFQPRLRVRDRTGKLLSGIPEASGPGASLRFDFSPPPNTYYAVEVSGVSSSSGVYTLEVSSLRAYDVYEPNDDFGSATRITIGQPIQANIMDSEDNDYYSFVSSTAGSVTIDVASRSADLIPGISTYAFDFHNIGMGPDVKTPGGSVHYSLPVEANQLYYIQVFAKNDTSGPYSLTLK